MVFGKAETFLESRRGGSRRAGKSSSPSLESRISRKSLRVPLAPWLRLPNAVPCAERVRVCTARRGPQRDSRVLRRALRGAGGERFSSSSRAGSAGENERRKENKKRSTPAVARFPHQTISLQQYAPVREERAARAEEAREDMAEGRVEVFFF